MQKNTHELRNRLLFTSVILVAYMVGRSILLFNVDSSPYGSSAIDSQNIMLQMISGDRYRCSIFALGITPYITSSLMVALAMALIGSETRSHISPQKSKRIIFFLLIILSIIMAVSRSYDLVFYKSAIDERLLRGAAAAEMAAGAVVIYKMVELNKEHGIGGQTPLFLVNILDGLLRTFQSHTIEELKIPLTLCGIFMVIIVMMESIILRIPVQRVSIHSDYADKNYIGFKLNPIGVMPVMFSTAVFSLFQMLVGFLAFLFGKDSALAQFSEQMQFTTVQGVNTYLCIVVLFTVLFSFVMLSPGEMAERLQKGGDSIVGVYAGKKTKRYLRRYLLVLSVVSGSILSLFMGISLYISLRGKMASDLAMLPATGMIVAGFCCTFYREFRTYQRFDSYRVFR